MKIIAPLCCLLALFAGSLQAADVIQALRADNANTPLTVYRPTGSCVGIAVLSPGAGGSEKGLAWLGDDLSQQGYLAVVMGHRESGLDVLKGDMRDAGGLRGGLLSLTTDSTAYQARFLDIKAALAWAKPQCSASYKVLLGHSMGAATVMMEAGADNKMGIHGENRFDAYVALSPQGAGSVFPEHAWHGIHKPVLTLTGTRDKALEGDWHTRTQPYADLPGGCQWLGVIDGATHMNLGGGAFSSGTESRAKIAIRAFLQQAPSGRCVLPVAPSGMTLDSK